MPRIRWGDRKFDFGFPVELHAEMIQEHVGHVADLDRSVFLTRPSRRVIRAKSG